MQTKSRRKASQIHVCQSHYIFHHTHTQPQQQQSRQIYTEDCIIVSVICEQTTLCRRQLANAQQWRKKIFDMNRLKKTSSTAALAKIYMEKVEEKKKRLKTSFMPLLNILLLHFTSCLSSFFCFFE